MIAYTQRIAFDVLTAPLAAVDRRTLSQAWYSALHLAHRPDAPPAAQATTVPHDGRPAGQAREVRATSHGLRAVRAEVPAKGAARRTGIPLAVERRTPRSALSRRIERATLRALPREGTNSCVVRAESGRIALLVRVRGDRVELIAICAAHARAAVARALEEARYALARRGLACAAHLREDAR